MTDHVRPEPPLVQTARRSARELNFEFSCAPDVGFLLAAMSAAVPADGRILELGTGAGVGLASIGAGLRDSTDVSVITVDLDQTLLEHTRHSSWPTYVEFPLADGADVVRDNQHPFDLIFADAPGGKLDGLHHTIAALTPENVTQGDASPKRPIGS
jgi:demethylmenaquinone methyltransferase/2-methoxy-6-polyprenyl-1,4-benzoquinol methylase